MKREEVEVKLEIVERYIEDVQHELEEKVKEFKLEAETEISRVQDKGKFYTYSLQKKLDDIDDIKVRLKEYRAKRKVLREILSSEKMSD